MKADITIPDWAEQIISDLTDMDRNPHRVDAEQVRRFTLELPDDVYFEYAFLDAAGEVKPDPENPVPAANPWYPGASALRGPDYTPSPYAAPEKQAGGRVERLRLDSAHLGQKRRLILYTPEGYEADALPVVYLQDGTAYYRIARLADVLETLLSEGRVRPAHLVFVEPVDRAAEYRFNPAYRRFMLDELVPLVEETFHTTSERVAMGASLGGLLSATLALEYPERFGTVIAQSGAFLGSPDELDFYRGKSSWVLDTLKQRDSDELRWYLEVGTLEWLTDVNRRVRDVLDAEGYDYVYQERNAGHNWTNWRNGLAGALEFALSKP